VDLFDWCGRQNVAAVPYGGGTSVVAGVNPPEHDRYRGVVSIDMKHFNKVLEVDQTSQAARIQAGVLGPDLERQLKPTGLTMRFFLQAWEFSSLGVGSQHEQQATLQPRSLRSTTTSRACGW
jgi:alkyldihydroxyacetonephosphate synthase